MIDYSELKRLAEAATPGHWEHRFVEGEGMPGAICHAHGWVADDFSEQAFTDTAYMAAANPAAVLELIAEIERLGERNVYWIDQANSIARDRNAIRIERDALLGLDDTVKDE